MSLFAIVRNYVPGWGYQKYQMSVNTIDNWCVPNHLSLCNIFNNNDILSGNWFVFRGYDSKRNHAVVSGFYFHLPGADKWY